MHYAELSRYNIYKASCTTLKMPEAQHSEEEHVPSKYLFILKSALQHSLSDLRETEYSCSVAEAVFKR